MSAPPILAVRRKIVARLKDDGTVAAAGLAASSIYGSRTDSVTGWPFSRCGEFEGEPGFNVRGNVHVFSKGDFDDEANEITEAIAASLDGAVLVLADGRTAHVTLTRTRMLPDPAEQSAWHGIVEIAARIERDCAD